MLRREISIQYNHKTILMSKKNKIKENCKIKKKIKRVKMNLKTEFKNQIQKFLLR